MYNQFTKTVTKWQGLSKWTTSKILFCAPIIGISERVHSDEQLAEMAENSERKYKLTQQQRAMETKLRTLKAQRIALSAAGDEIGAKQVQKKINEQQKAYRTFSEKNNLLYDTKRASVEGYRRISVVDKSQKNGIINVRSDDMVKELENQRYGRNKDTLVNKTYIDSGEYKRKFDSINENAEVRKVLYDKSKEMLKHRSGTEIEDMYFIDSTNGQIVAKEIDSQREKIIDYSTNTRKVVDSYRDEKLIAIHSHPNSMPPSISDLNSCCQNKYKCGYIACHNGIVFAYTSNEHITEQLYNMNIAYFLKNGFSEYEAQIKALEKLQTNHNIKFWEVK